MTQHTDTNPTPPLRRSRTDRVVAGVAAGVARRIDIPVWVIRAAFVVLAIFGGFGLALYLTGWLLIPDEDSDEPIVKGLFDRVHGATGWIGVALIALAALVVIDSIGFLRGDLTLAAILVVIGVLLYRGDLGRRRATETADPAGADPTPATGDPGGEPSAGVSPDRATAAAHPEDRPVPVPPRPRSPLGRVTFALALLAVGAMWLADTAMASFDPTPRHYLGVVVGMVGLGLLVGSWMGRARGLIVLGFLLTPALLVAPVLEGGLPGSFGERHFAATTASELSPRYELGAGRLVLDLRDLRLDGGEDSVEVSLGFGDLDIRLPADTRVEVAARIGAGELRIGDQVRSGLGREIEATLPGTGGVLRIDIEMNVGDVDVTRGTTAERAFDGFGDQRIVVVDPDDLEPAYDFAAGDVVLDLRGLRLDEPERVSVDLGAGELRVIVPAGATVDIEASVGFGTMNVFGDVRNGVGIDASYGSSGDTPELGLDLELGSGDLIVEEG